MLTGTPLDLTPFGSLFSLLGLGYWVLAIVLVGLAALVPKSWRVKVPMTAVVAAIFILPLTRLVEPPKTMDEAPSQLVASMALFAERCKNAGEKVHQKVEGVDGVVWMRWREKYSNEDNFADQFKLNDPFGRDCGLEDCIARLLRVTEGAARNPEEAQRHAVGYRFVETIDPRDGQRYRYTASLEHGWSQEAVERHKRESHSEVPSFSYRFTTVRKPIDQFVASFGVIWDDISSHEDREHWIAGGSLKIIDLRSNAVVAERVGYMVDPGQGSQAGFRSPWIGAVQNGCPAFPSEPTDSRPGRTLNETRDFLVRVLVPAQGE